MRCNLACLLIATFQFLAAGSICAQDELTDKHQRMVDQVGRAYVSGQMSEVLRLSGTIVESFTADELRLAGDRLKANLGLELSLVELAAEARVDLVLDGQGTRLRRPQTGELAAALIALDDRLTSLLDPVRRELDIGFPALIPDDVLSEKIPVLGTLTSRLDQAGLLLAHLQQIVSRLPAVDRVGLDGRAREIANRKGADDQRKLDSLRNHLTGRLVEFSLVRLNNAAATLGNETTSFDKRFMAAVRAEEALGTIRTHWDRYKAWKRREGGFDPNLEARWRAQEPQVRMRYTDLREKIVHFAEAKRLWLMGRYGRGPLAGGYGRMPRGTSGTVRAIPVAGIAPVLMPTVIRKPEDPLTVPIPFPPARRHQEWWRYPVDAVQLVGSEEYSGALIHFEQLLQLTSLAEQRVIDDLIADDDRFVVHSALSNRFDALDPNSTLHMAQRAPHPKAARPHERRGLAWVMAHARVELDAIRAVEQPGLAAETSVIPTAYEEDAYRELLLDSVRQHYYECFTEELLQVQLPIVTRVSGRSLVFLVQLEKKLAVVLALARTFRVEAAGRLSVTQENELDRWVARLLLQQTAVRELLAKATVEGTDTWPALPPGTRSNSPFQVRTSRGDNSR